MPIKWKHIFVGILLCLPSYGMECRDWWPALIPPGTPGRLDLIWTARKLTARWYGRELLGFGVIYNKDKFFAKLPQKVRNIVENDHSPDSLKIHELVAVLHGNYDPSLHSDNTPEDHIDPLTNAEDYIDNQEYRPRGVCRQKAAILEQVLVDLGYDAQYVSVRGQRRGDDTNHAIVRVHYDGRFWAVDPTTTDIEPWNQFAADARERGRRIFMLPDRLP